MNKPIAFYNEIDPQAAAWLRELIKEGHIANGVVDERSIADLTGADLEGFCQVHLFAGISGWSHALRLAGIADDRPVWTGSCPCQPFSSAGKQKGGADDRHLWPHMSRLIRECRPDLIFGEQVSGAIAHGWLDGISDDLEAEGYAVGPIVLPACSVGAPNIRQRLWWVAHRSEHWREVYCRSRGLLAAESMEVPGTREGVRLPEYAKREGVHAPDVGGCEAGGNHGPHQPQPARQSPQEPAHRDAFGEQSQPPEGERRTEAEGAQPLDRNPLDKQPILLAGRIQDGSRGAGGKEGSGSDDDGRLAHPDLPQLRSVASAGEQSVNEQDGGVDTGESECSQPNNSGQSAKPSGRRSSHRTRSPTDTASGSDLPTCRLGSATSRGNGPDALAGSDCESAIEGRERESGGSGSLVGLEHSPRDGRDSRRAESIGGSTASGCGQGPGGMGNTPLPESARQRQLIEHVPGQAGAVSGFWSTYDLIPCRDGKARRVGTRLQWMAARFSAGMVSGGTAGDYGVEIQQGEKEVIHGKKNEARSIEALQSLRRGPETEADAIGTNRGHGQFSEAAVLQSGLHGQRDGGDESGIATEQPEAVEEIMSGAVRAVRTTTTKRSALRASHRRESAEQRTIKFEDFVRLLPSAGAYAEIEGDSVTTEALRVLHIACKETGHVPEALSTLEEAWRSLPDSIRRELWRTHCEGRFVTARIHPLANSVPARVGLLRGYGNSINPHLAAMFILAAMEVPA